MSVNFSENEIMRSSIFILSYLVQVYFMLISCLGPIKSVLIFFQHSSEPDITELIENSTQNDVKIVKMTSESEEQKPLRRKVEDMV